MPGEVDVVARVVGRQPVEGLVVDAAERERRAEVVPLGGVVVDDVEDHLDPGAVQRLDHRLELVDLLADRSRRVARDGGRRTRSSCSPSSSTARARRDGGRRTNWCTGISSTAVTPSDSRCSRTGSCARAEVRAADLRRDRRMELGHPLHVGLVDDGAVPRRLGPPILAPCERGVDHHALRHRARAVAFVEGEVLVRMPDLVAVDRVAPSDRSAHRPRVRIEEQLVRVEPMTLSRLPRSVHPVAVEAAGSHIREVGVPEEVGPVRERDPLGLHGVVRPVEQAEVDPVACSEKSEKLTPSPSHVAPCG